MMNHQLAFRMGWCNRVSRVADNLSEIASEKQGKNLGVEVIAICDINTRTLERVGEKYPAARRYVDFRELYADRLDDIDAVVVSTTEHTHAFATLPALRAKKHVYCEKPMTRDVYECRLVTEAAAEAGVMTQQGTQIHSKDNYRRVVEVIQSGAIGTIKEAHSFVDRAWGWQTAEQAIANRDLLHTQETPTNKMIPPDDLNWDLWVGPAPYRDFHEYYWPGPRWYRWWDFGNGTMSDLGSHRNDLVFWALDLDAPTSVRAGGAPIHYDIAPASMWAEYQYPERNGRPAVKVFWYQGTERPPAVKEGIAPNENGVLFIGTKGMLHATYSKYTLLPEEDFRDFEPPARIIESSPGQHAEWVLACRGEGPEPLCNFAYAGPLTEANHLGNVAFRSGKKIQWDAKKMRIPNYPAAERYLARTYRKGWSLT
ncbi:MAG: Gfo/Idh/MocA family oxidoreductase [Planctomycetota bacterium]